MKRAAAASCVLWIACGGAPAPEPVTEPAPESASDVRVAEDATVAELLEALRATLRARGHEGECFLAWDVEGGAQIRVAVGERERSAAVSCDGLQSVATALEGRCPFVRFFWIEGEDARTEALTFYFAPPGQAYAARPVAAAGIGAPAADAVFREGPEGTRLVLGVPLPERPRAAKKQDAAPADSPLADPEILQGVQQLVARVQRCNPDGEGSLVVEWQVEPDGTIADVHPVTATVPDAAVQCALELLREASFPEHDGEGAIDYCVPVMLDPSLRPRAAPASAAPEGRAPARDRAPAAWRSSRAR